MSDVPDPSDAIAKPQPGHGQSDSDANNAASAQQIVRTDGGTASGTASGAPDNLTDSDSPGLSKNRATILVIDTTPLSLIALAGVLDTEGYACICARTPTAATEAMRLDKIDIVVCDVGDDAPGMLDLLANLRSMVGESELPAVLIADQRWVGLEKRIESLGGTTRCLFKPIDPGSLLAVVEQLLWMPQVVAAHRRRGTRPGRPGWVSL
jgi:response regulator RpfG family c-di-GMP phosphodiesterase